MNWAAVVNCVVAFLVAGVVYSAINRMNGVTSHAVRFSVLLVFIGMLAQALAVPLRAWEAWANTLLYGGVAALVVASRRLPNGVPPELTTPLAFAIMLVTLLLAYWVAHL